MYIAKRHHEETKKVELILVKASLFSILWKSVILMNSMLRSFRKAERPYSNEDGWLQGEAGVSKLVKKVMTFMWAIPYEDDFDAAITITDC